MKVIISPAMNMKKCEGYIINTTEPVFKNKANHLASVLKKYAPFELETALNINYKLSEKVFLHYQNFDVEKDNVGYPALLYFDGLAYKNIKANEFSKEQFEFANKHLRILSAMYGILKPSDLIQQYRLDFMGEFAKQNFTNGNLYSYWQEEVYSELYKENDVVLNLCSAEYEKIIKKRLLPSDKFISCKFLINKNGKTKSLATYAKMARGKMVKYVVENKITEVEKVKEFNEDGFIFCKEENDTLVFIKQ